MLHVRNVLDYYKLICYIRFFSNLVFPYRIPIVFSLVPWLASINYKILGVRIIAVLKVANGLRQQARLMSAPTVYESKLTSNVIGLATCTLTYVKEAIIWLEG